MANEEKFLKAIKKLREDEKKRKFNQTVDLIVNLKNFDVKREGFNLSIPLPYKIKDKKVAGFLEKNSEMIKTIKKEDFVKYKEKKDIKKLIKEYDNFIANAKLMPDVATSFGRFLGPVGKMPSPQLGILVNEDENTIKDVLKKVESSVKIIIKEPSIKIPVAKESLKDEEILKNILTIYNKILETLPKKADNVKSVKIKLTMGKPINVEL